MNKILHEDFIYDNEYYRKYIELIEHRLANPIIKEKFDGCENHHIIPAAMNGSDDEDNMVLLLGREHFMAHFYLPEFTLGESYVSMLYAFHRMQGRMKGMKGLLTEDQALIFEDTRKAYSLVHSERQRRLYVEEPERREQKSETMRRIHENDPERRVRASILRKEMNKSPEHKKRLEDTWDNDPNRREAQSKRSTEMMNAKWQEPEFIQMHKERQERQNADPEFRKKNSEGTKKQWQDPEFRRNTINAVKEKHKDPVHKKKLSDGLKERSKDPEFKKRQREGSIEKNGTKLEMIFEDGRIEQYRSKKEAVENTDATAAAIGKALKDGKPNKKYKIISVKKIEKMS